MRRAAPRPAPPPLPALYSHHLPTAQEPMAAGSRRLLQYEAELSATVLAWLRVDFGTLLPRSTTPHDNGPAAAAADTVAQFARAAADGALLADVVSTICPARLPSDTVLRGRDRAAARSAPATASDAGPPPAAGGPPAAAGRMMYGGEGRNHHNNRENPDIRAIRHQFKVNMRRTRAAVLPLLEETIAERNPPSDGSGEQLQQQQQHMTASSLARRRALESIFGRAVETHPSERIAPTLQVAELIMAVALLRHENATEYVWSAKRIPCEAQRVSIVRSLSRTSKILGILADQRLFSELVVGTVAPSQPDEPTRAGPTAMAASKFQQQIREQYGAGGARLVGQPSQSSGSSPSWLLDSASEGGDSGSHASTGPRPYGLQTQGPGHIPAYAPRNPAQLHCDTASDDKRIRNQDYELAHSRSPTCAREPTSIMTRSHPSWHDVPGLDEDERSRRREQDGHKIQESTTHEQISQQQHCSPQRHGTHRGEHPLVFQRPLKQRHEPMNQSYPVPPLRELSSSHEIFDGPWKEQAAGTFPVAARISPPNAAATLVAMGRTNLSHDRAETDIPVPQQGTGPQNLQVSTSDEQHMSDRKFSYVTNESSGLTPGTSPVRPQGVAIRDTSSQAIDDYFRTIEHVVDTAESPSGFHDGVVGRHRPIDSGAHVAQNSNRYFAVSPRSYALGSRAASPIGPPMLEGLAALEENERAYYEASARLNENSLYQNFLTDIEQQRRAVREFQGDHGVHAEGHLPRGLYPRRREEISVPASRHSEFGRRSSYPDSVAGRVNIVPSVGAVPVGRPQSWSSAISGSRGGAPAPSRGSPSRSQERASHALGDGNREARRHEPRFNDRRQSLRESCIQHSTVAPRGDRAYSVDDGHPPAQALSQNSFENQQAEKLAPGSSGFAHMSKNLNSEDLPENTSAAAEVEGDLMLDLQGRKDQDDRGDRDATLQSDAELPVLVVHDRKASSSSEVVEMEQSLPKPDRTVDNLDRIDDPLTDSVIGRNDPYLPAANPSGHWYDSPEEVNCSSVYSRTIPALGIDIVDGELQSATEEVTERQFEHHSASEDLPDFEGTDASRSTGNHGDSIYGTKSKTRLDDCRELDQGMNTRRSLDCMTKFESTEEPSEETSEKVDTVLVVDQKTSDLLPDGTVECATSKTESGIHDKSFVIDERNAQMGESRSKPASQSMASLHQSNRTDIKVHTSFPDQHDGHQLDARGDTTCEDSGELLPGRRVDLLNDPLPTDTNFIIVDAATDGKRREGCDLAYATDFQGDSSTVQCGPLREEVRCLAGVHAADHSDVECIRSPGEHYSKEDRAVDTGSSPAVVSEERAVFHQDRVISHRIQPDETGFAGTMAGTASQDTDYRKPNIDCQVLQEVSGGEENKEGDDRRIAKPCRDDGPFESLQHQEAPSHCEHLPSTTNGDRVRRDSEAYVDDTLVLGDVQANHIIRDGNIPGNLQAKTGFGRESVRSEEYYDALDGTYISQVPANIVLEDEKVDIPAVSKTHRSPNRLDEVASTDAEMVNEGLIGNSLPLSFNHDSCVDSSKISSQYPTDSPSLLAPLESCVVLERTLESAMLPPCSSSPGGKTAGDLRDLSESNLAKPGSGEAPDCRSVPDSNRTNDDSNHQPDAMQHSVTLDKEPPEGSSTSKNVQRASEVATGFNITGTAGSADDIGAQHFRSIHTIDVDEITPLHPPGSPQSTGYDFTSPPGSDHGRDIIQEGASSRNSPKPLHDELPTHQSAQDHRGIYSPSSQGLNYDFTSPPASFKTNPFQPTPPSPPPVDTLLTRYDGSEGGYARDILPRAVSTMAPSSDLFNKLIDVWQSSEDGDLSADKIIDSRTRHASAGRASAVLAATDDSLQSDTPRTSSEGRTRDAAQQHDAHIRTKRSGSVISETNSNRRLAVRLSDSPQNLPGWGQTEAAESMDIQVQPPAGVTGESTAVQSHEWNSVLKTDCLPTAARVSQNVATNSQLNGSDAGVRKVRAEVGPGAVLDDSLVVSVDAIPCQASARPSNRTDYWMEVSGSSALSPDDEIPGEHIRIDRNRLDWLTQELLTARDAIHRKDLEISLKDRARTDEREVLLLEKRDAESVVVAMTELLKHRENELMEARQRLASTIDSANRHAERQAQAHALAQANVQAQNQDRLEREARSRAENGDIPVETLTSREIGSQSINGTTARERASEHAQMREMWEEVRKHIEEKMILMIDRRDAELGELRTELVQRQRVVDDLQRVKDDLAKQNSAVENRIVEVKRDREGQVARSKEQLAEMRGQVMCVTRFSKKLEDVYAETEHLRAEVAESQAKMTAIASSTGITTREAKELKDELERSKAEVAKWREAAENARAERLDAMHRADEVERLYQGSEGLPAKLRRRELSGSEDDSGYEEQDHRRRHRSPLNMDSAQRTVRVGARIGGPGPNGTVGAANHWDAALKKVGAIFAGRPPKQGSARRGGGGYYGGSGREPGEAGRGLREFGRTPMSAHTGHTRRVPRHSPDRERLRIGQQPHPRSYSDDERGSGGVASDASPPAPRSHELGRGSELENAGIRAGHPQVGHSTEYGYIPTGGNHPRANDFL